MPRLTKKTPAICLARPRTEWSFDSFSIYLEENTDPEFNFCPANIKKYWQDHLHKFDNSQSTPRAKSNSTQRGKGAKGKNHIVLKNFILKKSSIINTQNNYSQPSSQPNSQGNAANAGDLCSEPEQEDEVDESVESTESHINTNFPISTWQSTKNTFFLTFLKCSIIDLNGLGEIDPINHKLLQDQMLKLPGRDDKLEYALSRFKDCKTRVDFIQVTETNPRPGNELPSEHNFICMYSNRAVSHWISHCQRLPLISQSLREGNYDIIWANIIDDLWSDDPVYLVLLRKEILCHHVGGSYRYDGIFRYNDGAISFDVGVTESSIAATNPNNDTKGTNDLSKVYLAMANMLRHLTERVRNNADIVAQLQVFGMVTSGLTLRVYRMQWADSSLCVVKNSDPFLIPLCLGQINHLFNIFRVLAKLKVAMKETVELVLRGSRHSISF